MQEGRIIHYTCHIRDLNLAHLPNKESEIGIALTKQLINDKALFGGFDEGIMGIYNAVIEDELLIACGIYNVYRRGAYGQCFCI